MNTTLRGLTVVVVTAFGLSAGAALPAEDNYGAIATSDSDAWVAKDNDRTLRS
jgi:hypothetical protein